MSLKTRSKRAGWGELSVVKRPFGGSVPFLQVLAGTAATTCVSVISRRDWCTA